MIAASLTLSGCAGTGDFSTQAGRIGSNDGTDSCRPKLEALDSTGNYFGADILTGAVLGAAGGALIGGLATRDYRGALAGAVAGGVAGGTTGYLVALQRQQKSQAAMYSQVGSDLSRDNAQIDRTQLAFDQLTECRFAQAAQIRADFRAGRIDRPTALAAMAAVRQRADGDIAVAMRIDGQIRGRSDQFVVAADSIAPGTKAAVSAPPPPERTATVRRPAQIKLRPDPSAPDIGSLAARERVTASRTRGDYVLVSTATGTEGYVAGSDLLGAPPPAAIRRSIPTPRGSSGAPGAAASGSAEDVRTLAGSNAARRDNFAESVAVSQKAASSGFELAA